MSKEIVEVAELVHVVSSHGDIYCDQDGVVQHIEGIWEEDPDGPSYIENIAKFDFKACEMYWGGESMEAFDVLELGGINKDGTTFEPDYQWLLQIDKRYSWNKDK